MATDPAFLFYSSDFLVGVADLNMSERGQYITLLCLQHQKGKLTKRIIDISTPNVSDAVLQKFSREGNFFVNKRLEVESNKRNAFCQSRRKNKEGKTKEHVKNISKSYVGTYENHMSGHMENENVNENTIGIEDSFFGKSENLFLIPEMLKVFLKHVPNYPANKDRDARSLFSIAVFFCDQGKLTGSPDQHPEKILEAWDIVSHVIAKDNFYCQKSLSTISNHIQEIFQTVKHGKSNSKDGRGINRSLLAQKFNDRDYGEGQTRDQ